MTTSESKGRFFLQNESIRIDCNVIIRMLNLNAYWLNNRLVCYVLLYVVALCVKMRYVILCIKRLLIDWLIDSHNESNRTDSNRRIDSNRELECSSVDWLTGGCCWLDGRWAWRARRRSLTGATGAESTHSATAGGGGRWEGNRGSERVSRRNATMNRRWRSWRSSWSASHSQSAIVCSTPLRTCSHTSRCL